MYLTILSYFNLYVLFIYMYPFITTSSFFLSFVGGVSFMFLPVLLIVFMYVFYDIIVVLMVSDDGGGDDDDDLLRSRSQSSYLDDMILGIPLLLGITLT
jgi:hypothetical protein